MDEHKPHAVLVPGPGLGHLNGSLLLAKALISVGFRVTLVCFEYAYQTHKGRINNTSQAAVHFEILADGLPPPDAGAGAATYSDLFRVTPSMHQNLLHLLQTNPATCLISDSFRAWTQHVADLVGIPRVDFWTSNATAYLNLLSLQGHVPPNAESKTPAYVDCIPGFTSFPLDEMIEYLYRDFLDKNPLLERILDVSRLAKHAHCVLIQSVNDLEREAFQVLKNVAHIDALPIGPLFHKYDNATLANSSNNVTLQWLDAHAPSSVIFVSFGSNFVHTNDEIVELAHGLEESGKAFLWVIRSNSIEKGCDIDVVLPHGFKNRTAGRGLIMPWVSQLSVLGHSAVGGFFSHCGWNSTLESMWMGVPMLTCPKGNEQAINNRLICKIWGAGIEIKTNREGTFSRHDVKIGICALLDETVGNTAREKAKHLSHVVRKAPFEGGQSHSNLLQFASKMKEQCLKHVLA